MRTVTADFCIETDVWHLRFAPGNYPQFVVRRQPGEVVLLYPPRFSFADPRSQWWLRRMLSEVLRGEAERVLPPRFKEHVERTGLVPSRLSVKRTHAQWGSCTCDGKVSLSLYLMFFPWEYIDSVMLHELCHLKEMNHGPRFWKLLDSFTDGKARQLRTEMREYARENRIAELMY